MPKGFLTLAAQTVFFAFASRDLLIAAAIERACKSASTDSTEYVAWCSRDLNGQPIDKGVSGWIDEADAVIADISVVNHNVTFEVAYALALGKPVYLV